MSAALPSPAEILLFAVVRHFALNIDRAATDKKSVKVAPQKTGWTADCLNELPAATARWIRIRTCAWEDAGMRYEMVLPYQIRAAIDGRWPVVLPLGVLEYHGEHMAVGMDTLAVTGILEILEKDMDIVILPPFHYGAASYAVEPPERTGTLHVDAETLLPFAKAMFQGLLRIGFRNIHAIIHHQTENFAAGMPTDLAFKLAARQATFAFLERERGEGWWRSEAMAGYYAQRAAGDDPFGWIRTHPLMSPESMDAYPFDHAGLGETSLLLALAPEGVDFARVVEDKWYARSARQASAELGRSGRDRILAHLRRTLGASAAD